MRYTLEFLYFQVDQLTFRLLREAHQNMFLITIMCLSVSAALVSILKTMILERENALHS